MLRASLDGAGGIKYLIQQAKDNPGPYMALIGKIIPQQIDATIRRELPEMTREQLLELLNHIPRRPMIDATPRGDMAATRPPSVNDIKDLDHD
jgi:hypothetical protein